jgi:Ni,Fe-hydrogenase I cytochrome b subunit
MAVQDSDYERHYRFWVGFTKFMKFGIAFIVTVLVLLAIFLV